MLNQKLLDILVCPACKSALRYSPEEDRLYCLDQDRDSRQFLRGERCGLIYPIREDIPIMLIDEAQKPED